jgi:hypothetical protein
MCAIKESKVSLVSVQLTMNICVNIIHKLVLRAKKVKKSLVQESFKSISKVLFKLSAITMTVSFRTISLSTEMV